MLIPISVDQQAQYPYNFRPSFSFEVMLKLCLGQYLSCSVKHFSASTYQQVLGLNHLSFECITARKLCLNTSTSLNEREKMFKKIGFHEADTVSFRVVLLCSSTLFQAMKEIRPEKDYGNVDLVR